MWRTALSLLLVGSTLFGQSVCCCTLKAVTFSSTDSEQHAADSCCCAEFGTSDNECRQQSKNSGHKCPCQKSKSVSAKLSHDQIVLPAQFADCFRLVAPRKNFERPLPLIVTRVDSHFGSSAFPHLDGIGILRAVNSLRC
jgi:hypothetical protein